jgi:hypothetical protein
MKIDYEYLTKDLGEASAILVSGLKVLRIQRESGVCFFVFDKSLAIPVSEKYWAGELLVDAKSYSETERSLKTRIFSQQ